MCPDTLPIFAFYVYKMGSEIYNYYPFAVVLVPSTPDPTDLGLLIELLAMTLMNHTLERGSSQLRKSHF